MDVALITGTAEALMLIWRAVPDHIKDKILAGQSQEINWDAALPRPPEELEREVNQR